MKSNGFYISRYEAGKEETNILVSKSGAKIWNDISHSECKQEAKKFSQNYNENIKSALCSGIQWDVIMGLINNKIDGSGKNIFDVKIPNPARHTNAGIVTTTGKNINDKVYNIYDLEGNAMEYVAERTLYKNSNNFIRRGGFYNYYDDAPASLRDSITEKPDLAASFRIVLYLN